MRLTYMQPTNDENMEFDTSTAHYLLTLQFVKSEFDINFKDDETTMKRIKKNSRKIYNVLFARAYSANAKLLWYVLNNTKEGRAWLFDMLKEQFEADNESAYNDLSSQPAINMSSGSVIAREELARNQISFDTEQIMERSATYLGFNVMYNGALMLL